MYANEPRKKKLLNNNGVPIHWIKINENRPMDSNNNHNDKSFANFIFVDTFQLFQFMLCIERFFFLTRLNIFLYECFDNLLNVEISKEKEKLFCSISFKTKNLQYIEQQ